jgi:O-succinylbenzoate synthase
MPTIEQIDLYHVAMPLIYPWRTAYGEDAAIHSLLVRLTSDVGAAWGEATPFAAPCYSPEFARGAFVLLRDWLAPRLVGKRIDSGAELQRLLSMFKGNPFAKAALDTAWWALASYAEQKPLYRLLGGTRHEVEVGADFGVMDSLDELLEAVGRAVDAGFPRIKLKFRRGWDLDMLEAVRRQHPRHPIHIDCNSGYTLADLPLFRQVDRFELAMIEQPLTHDDVVDHAKLQRAIATPVCLDESITSVERARLAIELASCRYVNIKPGRVGGPTVALQIHDLCRDAGIPCWVGGMLESAVGVRFCIALATLDNFTYAPDIFPSARFYVEDLGEPPICLTTSTGGRPAVAADDVPGNVSVPHPERLERLTIEHACCA